MKISKILALFSIFIIVSCGKTRVSHNDTFIKLSKPFESYQGELADTNLKLPQPNNSLSKFGWKQAKDIIINNYEKSSISLIDFNKEYNLKVFTKKEIAELNTNKNPSLFRYHVVDKKSFVETHKNYLRNNKKTKINVNNVKKVVKRDSNFLDGIF